MSKPNIRIPNLKFRGSLTPINKNRVTKIVQHHMAHPSWDVNDVHNAHKNSRGWSGIGYNYWIAFDGTIYQGRGMNVGAHVSGYNSTTIGVGYQGDFTKQNMTDAQLKSGAALNKWLMSQFPKVKSVSDIIGHNELAATACPAKNFRMKELKELIKGNKVTATSSNRSYLQKNDKGTKVKELQEKLIKAGYKLPKYGADGHFGSELESAVKELQKNHGLKVDGLFGKQSEEVLNKELEKLKGELTVSQAKELQKQIDELKKQLANKIDRTSKSNTPDTWAKEEWEKAIELGYFDGSKPKAGLTRQEAAIVLMRLIENNTLR